ncbi:MAG TPA: FecR family protein [Bacteroidetes bacterium]|nr:FecR family protein [Bacteroidota bacterium]
MKLNTNIPEHSKLIAKYISNEMNELERTKFETIVNSNKENKELINTMRIDWEQVGQIPQHQPNVNKAWDSLFNKLQSESLISSSPQKPRFVWAKVAATIILLLGMGIFLLIPSIQSAKIVVESWGTDVTLVHTLPDGSVVYLSQNASLLYSKRYGTKNRNLTLKGEAFFDVTRNPDLPFVIDATGVNVRVLGTSFSVKSSSVNDAEVVVETGKVSVTPKQKMLNEVTAEAGEKVTISVALIQKTLSSPTEKHSEKTKRLQFKDEPLQAIVNAVNKTYHANIIINPPIHKQPRLTVTFEDNSIPHIVEVIRKTLKLEAEYIDSTIILSEPN